MTLAAFAQQAQALPTLHGAECSRAFTIQGGPINVYFGPLASPDARGRRSPEGALIALTAWRLEISTSVLLGSMDEEATREERIQILVGKQVRDAEVFLPSYMVRVSFTGDLVLWLFPDEARYYGEARRNPQEAWEYPGAPWFVIGPDVTEGWE